MLEYLLNSDERTKILFWSHDVYLMLDVTETYFSLNAVSFLSFTVAIITSPNGMSKFCSLLYTEPSSVMISLVRI